MATMYTHVTISKGMEVLILYVHLLKQILTMNNDNANNYDRIAEIIEACKEVHATLGNGYLEAVYQDALSVELSLRNIPHQREKQIIIYYKGHRLAKDYFADFICYDDIIIETKATAKLIPEHKAQLINYLHATGIDTGILVNFGEKELAWRKVDKYE